MARSQITIPHVTIPSYLFLQISNTAKTLPYKIVVQTRAKRRGLPNFVDVLLVNLEFPRLFQLLSYHMYSYLSWTCFKQIGVVDWNGDSFAVWLAIKRRDDPLRPGHPNIIRSAKRLLQAMKKVFGAVYFTQQLGVGRTRLGTGLLVLGKVYPAASKHGRVGNLYLN